MYYTVYKITNKLDGRHYVGSHVTENLDDGYMGSGVLISNAVAKHGKSMFEKQIIFMAFDEEGLSWAERQLVVTRDQDHKSYNLVVGGKRQPESKRTTSESAKLSHATRVATGTYTAPPKHSDTIWINNGVENRRHRRYYLPLPAGFKRGRLAKGI